MRPKPNKKIDKLLGDLGLHPHALDPDEVAAGFDSLYPSPTPPPTGPCGKCCFSNETAARKAGNRIKNRGANTSFFRPYFCPKCKAWHLTSGKNVGPGNSTEPRRNAGRNRRNHSQPPPADES
ncbi:MAG: hypothetical protein MUF04_04600 [Akkermansiaceae bacterium]|nr:hypothetical protein [Akkermansiaceae bacterium]